MEEFNKFIKVTFPKYLTSLPIPRNMKEASSLSGEDLLRLVPLFSFVLLFVYVLTGELLSLFRKPPKQLVNQTIQKSKDKVVDILSRSELSGSIDKNEKVVFCRCWKSKTFPYCDGSHNKHNQTTGDNVGPLIINNK